MLEPLLRFEAPLSHDFTDLPTIWWVALRLGAVATQGAYRMVGAQLESHTLNQEIFSRGTQSTFSEQAWRSEIMQGTAFKTLITVQCCRRSGLGASTIQ